MEASLGGVSFAEPPTELFPVDTRRYVVGILPSPFSSMVREWPGSTQPIIAVSKSQAFQACRLSADILPDLRSFTNSQGDLLTIIQPAHTSTFYR